VIHEQITKILIFVYTEFYLHFMAICGRLECKGKACLSPAIDNSILKKETFIFQVLIYY